MDNFYRITVKQHNFDHYHKMGFLASNYLTLSIKKLPSYFHSTLSLNNQIKYFDDVVTASWLNTFNQTVEPSYSIPG